MINTLTATAIGLFLLSALMGVVVSFDTMVAFSRFALLAAGLLGAVALRPINASIGHDRVIRRMLIGCGWLAGLLGSFFLIGKTNIFFGNNVQILSSLANSALGRVAADSLIVLIPLGCGGLALNPRRRHTGTSATAIGVLYGVSLGVAVIAVLLSGSRGALIALAMAAFCGFYVWWRANSRDRIGLCRLGDVIVIASLLVLVIGSASLLMLPVGSLSGGLLPQAVAFDTLNGRIALWQDSLALIGDYRYTGSGLGVTNKVFSAYLFMLHTSYLSHAHNLYLQIAVEQGLPGLVTFLAIVFGTVWTQAAIFRHGTQRQRLMGAAAVAALVGALVHGLVNASLYASLLVPVLFVPFAVLWSVSDSVRRRQGSEEEPVQTNQRLETLPGAFFVVAAIALLFLLPGTRSALQANLGAVYQTRAELAVYVWPQWPIQDLVRRDHVVGLLPAVNRYQNALRYDADNVTAHRRLGQIALSMAEYDVALAHLQAAHAAAPNQRVVRRLLGEAYAANGQMDRALAMWQSVPMLSEQLEERQWWYSEYGEPQQQRWVGEVIAKLTSVSSSR